MGSGNAIEIQKEFALLLKEIGGDQEADETSKTTLQKVIITQANTTIAGLVSSYQDAEELESLFKSKNSRYCDVTLDTKGSRGRTGQQNFELTLEKKCEQ